MKKYPISLEGEQVELALVNLPQKKNGREITYKETLNYFKKHSLFPTMINHLVAFQKKYPQILKKHPRSWIFIFALGTIEEGKVPYLNSGKIDPRYIDWWDTRCNDFSSDKDLYFLVICNEKSRGYLELEKIEAQKRKRGEEKKERNKVRWPGDVGGESKTKMKLIKDTLEKATPTQLLAVRQYLKRFNAVYGYDSIYNVKEAAEEAFDAGRYEDPNISYLIEEGELVEILQHPENVNEICKKVKKDSIWSSHKNDDE